jgi:hypothetical protein
LLFWNILNYTASTTSGRLLGVEMGFGRKPSRQPSFQIMATIPIVGRIKNPHLSF